MKPSISVIGLGYVGLCTAVCFASKGFKVYGADIDEERVKGLRKGQSPIYEPRLEEFIKRTLRTRMFTPTTDIDSALGHSDVTFVSVGTPSLPDGSIDLSSVKHTSAAIGNSLGKKQRWHLVVIRSTVVPTTCDRVVKPEIEAISGKQCGKGWGLCVNPEFLKEGSAIHDTIYPDRVIIGESDERSGNTLSNLYRVFFRRNVIIERMSMANAELVKYASNTFLAMKVSFANMIANLCETVPSADVTVVTHAIGLDGRIGPAFLHAGLGYGGSCFPKDLKALVAFGKKQNVDLPLALATAEINEKQPLRAVSLGEKLIGELSGKRVAVLGLAFKPDTDDMRGAVSIQIIRDLLKRQAHIVAYDPKAIQQATKIFGNSISYAESAADCIRGSELSILVTEWKNLGELRPQDFKRLMKQPAIVDGRRLFNPSQFAGLKFAAVGLG
ncbi:MAG: UDP-glucose dehydrogenase family protein [Candidatus Bathyarchaeia archaeon]